MPMIEDNSLLTPGTIFIWSIREPSNNREVYRVLPDGRYAVCIMASGPGESTWLDTNVDHHSLNYLIIPSCPCPIHPEPMVHRQYVLDVPRRQVTDARADYVSV